jgi:hypothetical protein
MNINTTQKRSGVRLNINTNNNNGNRRRNRRKAVDLIVQPVNNNNGGNGQGKTARNRRRRLKKRLMLRGLGNGTMAVPRNYYNQYFSHIDPTMEQSVHRLIQSYFYPQQGIHRSISSGIEPTGLTLYQGSFEVATTATDNTISFQLLPTAFAEPFVAGSPTVPVTNFFSVSASPAPFLPPSQGAFGVGGPFSATNPASSGRVVSCTLNMIPASTTLNRGGEGKIGYVGDVNSLGWTRSDIDNLAISRAWDGIESMTMHWAPNTDEYNNTDGTAATALSNNPSGLVGYIVVPLQAIVIWRFEWQIGIEYEPNANFRPLIDRKVPMVRPDARYFINQVIQQHWTPLMISSYKDYLGRLNIAASIPGGLNKYQYADHAGLGGVGFKNPAERDVVEDWETIAKDRDDGLASMIGKGIANAGCTALEYATGEDVCGAPFTSAFNMFKRGLRGTANQLMLGN